MSKWFKNVNLTKHYFSFLLAFTGVLGFFLLAWFKGVDVGSIIPVIIGTYIGSRTMEKSVAVVSASKDPNCNTRQVLADLSGETPEKP